MPDPPGRMPRATSGWLNTASPIATNRRSHESVSSLPPPPTRPSITAIVGFGIVRKHSHMPWNAFSSVGGGRSVGICRISPTSKWAMKKSGFALRRTTTRASSSTASSSATLAISR